MSKRIVLIGNPVAGGGARKKIAKAFSVLKASGHDVELKFTSQKGDAESFAREASARSDTLVIAAGGDGTYNEVANGLLYSDTPLAILPLGTTSVLARELGIPLDSQKALEIALSGKTETVHLGMISLNRPSLPFAKEVTERIEPSRHFLLMAGIGYDGSAVYGVNQMLKKYSGKIAYILSGIHSIINYHPGQLMIRAAIGNRKDIEGGRFRIHRQHCSVTGDSLHCTGYTVIVSNAAFYGGDMKITPDASLTSPYLYVFVGHNKGRLDLVRHLAAIISGRTLTLKDISYFRTDKITIEGNSHIQLDGDYAGTTPVNIDIVRNALKLVVPG
jgi:diacylglycerol kinase family enzyme